MELSWNRNASKAIILNRNLRLLSPPVLENHTEPRENETRNIDGSRGDEVVPTSQCVVTMPKECNHEYDDTGKVCQLEELISEAPSRQVSCSPRHQVRMQLPTEL